ncbi:MAG: START-like domain-containing protein [Flavobacteriales bacterium]
MAKKKPVTKKVVAKKVAKGVKPLPKAKKAVGKKPMKKAIVKKANVKKAPVRKAAAKKEAQKKLATTKAVVTKGAVKKVAPTKGKVQVKGTPAPVAPKPSVQPPTTPSKPTDRGPKKGPMKERVVMEFYMHSSPTSLYDLISTPSGFAEWYCQDVDVRDDQYTFIFGESEREETTLIGRKMGEVIRFRRNDEEEYTFFEFRVRIDAMTNEVALVVTDHAWPNEIEETRNLWSAQIHDLMRVLGA